MLKSNIPRTMVKIIKKIFFVLMIAIISSGITAILIIRSNNPEILPKKIIMREKSPDGQKTALIYESQTGEFLNILGSDTRFYLGLKKNDVTTIIDYDLSEGMGAYEGGIEEIKWLNNNEIVVKRYIADQKKDIVFNFKEYKWYDLIKK